MNSGTIVQARDHVLIGSRLPVRSAFSTFVSKPFNDIRALLQRASHNSSFPRPLAGRLIVRFRVDSWVGLRQAYRVDSVEPASGNSCQCEVRL